MQSKLRAVGITEEKMAEYVRRAAENAAETANAGGLKEQIAFINQNGYSDAQLWEWIVGDEINKGVSEIKAVDGTMGDVYEVYDDGLSFISENGDVREIGFDEVEHFQPVS